MTREGNLPSTVDAQCGTINYKSAVPAVGRSVEQAPGGRFNQDGTQCGHNATRFVKSDEGDVEVLTCARHVDRARDRVAEVSDHE